MRTSKPKTKKHQHRKYGEGKRHTDAAGIDLGAQSHYVALPAGRAKNGGETVRQFGSYTSSLREMASWLKEHNITTAAMEATGVYWVPVYCILEEAGIEVVLVNAQHYHNVPGRKTDVKDCQWLQTLHENGLLTGSFVPPPNVLSIRAIVRHQETKQSESSQHILRMQKHMEQMNFQLHKVLDDISGQTGMAIIRDLVKGETAPEALSKHRHPNCRASIQEFTEAMTGDLRAEHLFCLRQELESLDACKKQIDECEEKLKTLWQGLASESQTRDMALLPEAKNPRDDQEKRRVLFSTVGVDLTKIPGFSTHNASQLLAEIGPDISRWPTAAQFRSWCRTAPGRGKTGGKWMASKGSRPASRVRQIFLMGAHALARSNTALGGYYRRRRAQKGPAFAAAVTANKLANMVWLVMSKGIEFLDAGNAAYEKKHRDRIRQKAVQSLKGLGYDVSLSETPAT